MPMQSVLDFAHHLAAQALEPGGLAVDATIGNGHDTIFLARKVGAGGRVVGFDVQEEAVEETRRRLRSEGPAASVQLIRAGHETMLEHLGEPHRGAAGAVMFNLGYLPGGDHFLTTEPNTTRQALNQSTELLRPGGVITIVLYTGHEGGSAEAEAVHSWASALPQQAFQALSYRFVNQTNDPPRLIAVEKNAEAAELG